MGEFELRTDPHRNRLYIRLSGFFRGSDSDAMFTELQEILAELQPGFDVVTDISKFLPASPEVARSLRRGAELIKNSGRRRAVRVAGSLVVGLMQFRREVDEVFDEETTRYAKTLEEADRILDGW